MTIPPGPPVAGRRILVTGGTGFVGSAFVRHAVAAGAQVVLLSRPSSDHWRLAPVLSRIRVAPTALDPDAADALGPSDVVVHFAPAGVDQSFDDVDELVRTNVSGTLAALHLAQRTGAGRFVLAGSSGEYGPGVGLREDAPLRPTSEYGATRAAATLLARSFGERRGLDVVVVRPFSVYGPYEAAYRLIPYAVLRGLVGAPIEISSGVQTRDFVHVEDVAAGVALAAVLPEATGGTFNLCTGTSTSVRDLAELVASAAGGGSTVVGGVRPPIPGEMWRTSGNGDQARDVLGWTAVRTVEQGVRETVRWFAEGGATLPAYTTGP